MMNFVKSSNGITVFGNNGEISMFPHGTFEFYCASQIKDGNFEDFPFLKSKKIYKRLSYDKDTKLIALDNMKFNAAISNTIKRSIWDNDWQNIENFYNFIENASEASVRFLNRYALCETFENMFSSDEVYIQMHENEVLKAITGFDSTDDGILLDVIVRIDENGNIVFTGAAPKQDYTFSEEYQTVFNFWVKYISSRQSSDDVDEFFDDMNKKLNIVYSIEQNMLNMRNPLLSDILSKSLSHDVEYEDAF